MFVCRFGNVPYTTAFLLPFGAPPKLVELVFLVIIISLSVSFLELLNLASLLRLDTFLLSYSLVTLLLSIGNVPFDFH